MSQPTNHGLIGRRLPPTGQPALAQAAFQLGFALFYWREGLGKSTREIKGAIREIK